MRRNVVLLAVLAFGLALAGPEQWVGHNPQHSYQIPNPEPGIFPESPQAFMPAVDTFKYDDGMPGSAWCWNQGGNGWGVKFISPSDNVTLTGALVHFYSGWPQPGGTNAMFKVYADDGPGGTPGTEIWASDTVTIVRGEWNFIPVDEPIIGTNYYIFYVQVDSNPMCPGLSIDAFNNAPSHRMWTYSETDGFAEDARRGEWLIRAVCDWEWQTTNATAQYFASNMPLDTTPDINLYVRTFVKNLGTATIPAGTPVRLQVTGPQSYVYEDTMNTSADLPSGQRVQINFSPAWRIPQTSGNYAIKVWPEAAGEQWPADDPITYDLSVAQWIEYADFDGLNWLTWGGPMRATHFDPGDFGLQYPVGLSRARHQFYAHPQYPWPDSSFRFKVYGDDGSTLLYESDEVEAAPGTPGPITYCDFDSTLIIESGTFYVAVAPVSSSGHPSSCGDGEPDGHSFQGQPGSWIPWTMGEYFTSASCQGGVGIGEGGISVRQPRLSVSGYPNPVGDFVTIRWQVPNRQSVRVELYDATGRCVRHLYSSQQGLTGSTTLDARSLPAGIYLVRLEAASGTATRKLVLER